jgi:hypothetical protein
MIHKRLSLCPGFFSGIGRAEMNRPPYRPVLLFNQYLSV